jgi:ABC-type uncharacterized transport system substrate-binding protein
MGRWARIASLAAAIHLPTLYVREFVEAGCLVSYAANLAANERRAAYFVDRILRSAKPADLPIEFPTKLEMVINLKTAEALGLTIAPTLLAQANEVIE